METARQRQNSKPDGAILKKKVSPAVQHRRRDGISLKKSSNRFYTGKILDGNLVYSKVAGGRNYNLRADNEGGDYQIKKYYNNLGISKTFK